MRTRAERLAHLQPTYHHYPRPELGKPLADKAPRAGGAARGPDPAVQKHLAVALALRGDDDQGRNDVAWSLVNTAQHPEAPTVDRRPAVPGIGQSLSLVLLSAIHALTRFPRVPAVVSSCRLGTGAQASTGKREGTSGTQIGNASLQWACSEAALLCLRAHPAGQTSGARGEHKHGQGQALPLLAQQLARASYARWQRETAFALPKLLKEE